MLTATEGGKAPSPALQRKLEKQAADAAKAAAKAKAEAEQRKRAEELEARAALYPLPEWDDLLQHAKKQALEGNVDPAILYHAMLELTQYAGTLPPQWPPRDVEKVQGLRWCCCCHNTACCCINHLLQFLCPCRSKQPSGERRQSVHCLTSWACPTLRASQRWTLMRCFGAFAILRTCSRSISMPWRDAVRS